MKKKQKNNSATRNQAKRFSLQHVTTLSLYIMVNYM